jgi:hypothetical protein
VHEHDVVSLVDVVRGLKRSQNAMISPGIAADRES